MVPACDMMRGRMDDNVVMILWQNKNDEPCNFNSDLFLSIESFDTLVVSALFADDLLEAIDDEVVGVVDVDTFATMPILLG